MTIKNNKAKQINELMRICLIGDFRTRLDEGFVGVAANLAGELGKRYDVVKLDIRRPYTLSFWKIILGKQPKVIHYFSKPSFLSFLILKSVAFFWRKAVTVLSALHPDAIQLRKHPLFKLYIHSLKPDMVLVQSPEVEDMFKSFGCATSYLYNGVDTKRFTERTHEEKMKLRDKYGIPRDKFIILHVGHLKKRRNLELLLKLQKEDNQVLIVASTYENAEASLRKQLIESGCIIWSYYIVNIQEVYGLADCYVLPFKEHICISVPLALLEALASNLPVISSRYGAIPAICEEGKGLFFADRDEDFISLTESVKREHPEVRTRDKVSALSWEAVDSQLEKQYGELLDGEK